MLIGPAVLEIQAHKQEILAETKELQWYSSCYSGE